MRLIGNIIWFFMTGFWTMVTYFLLGLFWCVTIIGIPFGLQAFKLASLSLFPFGKTVNVRFGKHPIMNILWIIFGGFSLALFYLFEGIFYCCTIIGIPFGLQCFKQATLSIAPFGAEIV